MKRTSILWLVLFFLLCAVGAALARAPAKKPEKKDKNLNQTKIIPKKAFYEALVKLAKDERVPVASSTLVEKGRGDDYYAAEKILDQNPETFWAEGVKGSGKNEWVAFAIVEESTHLEITPGAGREQFENFNRPKTLLVDIYQVKLPQKDDEYDPQFKWLGRATYNFQDKNVPVVQRLPVQLPELAMGVRSMYVGVIILQDVYRGQFDDTAINEIKITAVWGAD